MAPSAGETRHTPDSDGKREEKQHEEKQAGDSGTELEKQCYHGFSG
jgi:hypothetical protein